MQRQQLGRIATDKARYEVNPSSGCWTWNGATSRSGHGVVRVGTRIWQAHRVFYVFFVGSILSGLVAHHTCHTPSCVNPLHIQIVTREEHNRIHNRAKLDYTKAAEIRRIWRAGEATQARIAEHFGVDASTISLVVNNKTWRAL